MSNYSKTTDFAAKDALTTGNANKIVKGTEIDDEFDALQTAVNSKADVNNTTFTGSTTIPSVNCNGGAIDGTVIGADTAAAVTGTNNTQLATTAFVQTASTTANISAGTIDNAVIGGTTKAAGTFTNVVADYLQVDGGTLAVDNINNRVGINNNSPTTDLDLVGSAKVSGNVTAAKLNTTAIATKSTMTSSDVVLVMDGNEIKKITQATLVNFTQASVQVANTGWSPQNTYYSEAAAIAWAQAAANAAQPANFNFQVATYQFTSGDREWMAFGTYNYF